MVNYTLLISQYTTSILIWLELPEASSFPAAQLLPAELLAASWPLAGAAAATDSSPGPTWAPCTRMLRLVKFLRTLVLSGWAAQVEKTVALLLFSPHLVHNIHGVCVTERENSVPSG